METHSTQTGKNKLPLAQAWAFFVVCLAWPSRKVRTKSDAKKVLVFQYVMA